MQYLYSLLCASHLQKGPSDHSYASQAVEHSSDDVQVSEVSADADHSSAWPSLQSSSLSKDEVEAETVSSTSMDCDGVPVILDLAEENSLYHLAGWAVHKTMKAVCQECKEMVKLSDGQHTPSDRSNLTEFKSFGHLIHPSETVFRLLEKADGAIREKEHDILFGKGV